MRALKGGKPRRYEDHRRLVARPYNVAYEEITERHPPRDRLGRRLAGLVADLFVDYERLARSRRATPRTSSARRKTAGLIFGGLRLVAEGRNGHGESEAEALVAALRERS